MGLSGIVSEEIKSSTMKGEISRKSFSLAMAIPSLLMLLIGLALTFADPDRLLAMKLAPSALILAGMQVMFVCGGVILLALGLLIHATGRLVKKSE